MKFTNEILWNKGLTNNRDPYGARVYSYARDWAEMMETAMDGGAQLEDVAEELSHRADTDGITGYMYGAAVAILSACWIHGERLRRWHNLDTQIGDEGERANERGTVLNPAVIAVGPQQQK